MSTELRKIRHRHHRGHPLGHAFLPVLPDVPGPPGHPRPLFRRRPRGERVLHVDHFRAAGQERGGKGAGRSRAGIRALRPQRARSRSSPTTRGTSPEGHSIRGGSSTPGPPSSRKPGPAASKASGSAATPSGSKRRTGRPSPTTRRPSTRSSAAAGCWPCARTRSTGAGRTRSSTSSATIASPWSGGNRRGRSSRAPSANGSGRRKGGWPNSRSRTPIPSSAPTRPGSSSTRIRRPNASSPRSARRPRVRCRPPSEGLALEALDRDEVVEAEITDAAGRSYWVTAVRPQGRVLRQSLRPRCDKRAQPRGPCATAKNTGAFSSP